MAGHWYSTQGDGHCNETSGTCGWKTVEVKKVVNANCVNDQIVHAVQARNASCFDALANKTDRTTDGWITCMFEGLLGDRKKNAPAIAGGMLNTFPQVAQLRQKILDPGRGLRVQLARLGRLPSCTAERRGWAGGEGPRRGRDGEPS